MFLPVERALLFSAAPWIFFSSGCGYLLSIDETCDATGSTFFVAWDRVTRFGKIEIQDTS